LKTFKFLIPFVSFAICYSLKQPLAFQSSIIAIILLITLITAAFKNRIIIGWGDIDFKKYYYIVMYR